MASIREAGRVLHYCPPLCPERAFLYWLLPSGRGRGAMADAVVHVSRWALDDLGLHRLRITHSVANAASCQVAEKAGFAFEGTMRSVLLHSDGWHDEHLHARVQGDAWPW